MAKSAWAAKLDAKRRHYDPATEGYGSPDEWMGAFRERMGVGEAKEVLKGKGPRAVLGVTAAATWEEIRKAFRKLALEHHPDRVPEAEKPAATVRMREILAAFSLLANEFGK